MLNPRTMLAARRADGVTGLVVVIGIAIIWILWFLPHDFVHGTASYWRTDIEDVTQYQSGFNAFFSEPWSWPLLRIESLNFPDGTLASFVDIIPLYASLLKLLVPNDRFPFNPFGYWVGLCYILQAVGAWWLLREARLPRYGALVALGFLVLVMPAFTARVVFGHVSLMSHWLILFALALYLRSGRRGRPAVAAWAVLLFGAFFVNFYVCVMAGLVFGADIARFGTRLGWLRAIGALVLPPALILASLPVTMLPLPHVSRVTESGFGFYSMNLLAPLAGEGRLTSWITRVRVWEVEGQYEGYNYLGVGIWLLVVIAVALRLRHDPEFFRRHWSLVAVLAFASAFALSNRVYVGHRLLLEWPVPPSLDWLFGTFRASGRFFWPAGYALAAFAVLTSVRWLPPRLAIGALALALVLQSTDLQPVHGLAQGTLNRPATRILDPARWDAALDGDIRTIYLYPKFGCSRNPTHTNQILAVQRYATERRLRLNTGYIARYHPPCDTGRSEVTGSDPKTSAYVFLRGEEAAERTADYFPPGARGQCRELDIAVLCR